MDAQTLLQQLDPRLLSAEATSLTLLNRGLTDDIEDVAGFLYRGVPRSPTASVAPGGDAEDARPDRRYWDFVKAEMRVFLCTDDPKYQRLWNELREAGGKSTTAIVAIVASFIGGVIGAPAALLTAFVAVCLGAALKIGTAAYCNYSAPGADA